jgi:metal-responsive CopG/Arc/MetJ family transcriptional regulator
VDATIDRLTIEINPALLVRLNKYASDNRVSRQEAILELVELGLASQRR